MSRPDIIGLGHLDITVNDGERAMSWWAEVMGFTLLARWVGPGCQGWTMVHPSGLAVTAIAHDGGAREPFDERRVGLDHVAFQVRDVAELEAWVRHLDQHGVSHSGIKDHDGGRGGPLIVLRDPDNIQIELTAGWRPASRD
jgi:glyoxylase I family protein